MSLEQNNWMIREQQKVPDPKKNYSTETHQQVRGHKIPVKQFVDPAECVNRFTQTEQKNSYHGKCIDNGKGTMFDGSMQQHQQQQQPQQGPQHHLTQLYTLEKKDDKQPSVAEFPFCYNVNMLQKVHQQSTNPNNIGVGNNPGDDKGYRFDVSQPFSYNYALVNQMSLAAAASTATFKCDVCGLAFGHVSLLNHHKRIHTNTNSTSTNNNNFSCDQCGQSFNLASDLKNHKHTAHATQQKTKNCSSCGVEVECEAESPKSNKSKNKTVRCENCSSSSDRESSFDGTQEASTETEEIHPKGMYPVKRRGMATVTKCHKCNGSGIIFIGGVQNQTEKPYHCNVCDGTFSRYSSLWSHKRLHSGDKPFKCEFCGITFARAAYLKNHSRVHSGERPYKCEVCGMQFSQSPHLKNHERIHSGERPYECEICSKTFARHSTLWNHRRIHTGEKPYRCNICGSAFNQATHLKNHAKVHTGEKPHRCDICEVGFSDRFALKRHRAIHEKYGQTATNRQGNTQNMGEMYNKCAEENDTMKQNQAVQAQPPPQPPQLGELYKCDVVTGGIAFPGCSRPQETK